MAFIYAMADTWNNNATDFTAISMVVTDTTSGVGSLLFNVNTSYSYFRVNKYGALGCNNGTGSFGIFPVDNGGSNVSICFNGNSPNAANAQAMLGNVFNGFTLTSNFFMGWGDNPGQSPPDTSFRKVSAGLVELNTGVTASYAHLVLFTSRSVAVTLASLPTAASMGAGARAHITNGLLATFNTTAAGAGTNIVPVFSDGTQWRYG